ncbi:MAG: hypothetical protein JJ863_20870 [Deltaproteobacteria bacterium]|nr:hypothetical protein [Deltaproteobacteria bacterium]
MGDAVLRTRSVNVGSHEMLVGDGQLRRGEDGVERVFDTVVEEVRPHVAGVEQRWRFGTSPQGSGPLVVRVEVPDGELVASTERGLALRVGEGLLTYGQGTWIDASGAQTTVAPQWDQGSITLTVPEGVWMGSRYPAVLDPVIGTLEPLDPPVPVAFTVRSHTATELVVAPTAPTREIVVTRGSSDYYLWSLDTTTSTFSPDYRRLDNDLPQVACTSGTRCVFREDRLLEFFDAETFATVVSYPVASDDELVIAPISTGYVILFDDALGRRFVFYTPDGVETGQFAAPAYDRFPRLMCSGPSCIFTYYDDTATSYFHRSLDSSGVGPEVMGSFAGFPWGTDGYVSYVNHGDATTPDLEILFHTASGEVDATMTPIAIGAVARSAQFVPIPGGSVLVDLRGPFFTSDYGRAVLDASGTLGTIVSGADDNLNRARFHCVSPTACTYLENGTPSPSLSRMDLTGDLFALTPLGYVTDRYSQHGQPDVAYGGGAFAVSYLRYVETNEVHAALVDTSGPLLPGFELGTTVAARPSVDLAFGSGAFLAAWGDLTFTRRFDSTGPLDSSPATTSSAEVLAMAGDGTNFMAVLNGTSTRVMTFNAVGSPLMAAPVELPAPPALGEPSITFGGGQYFVAWSGNGARAQDIFAVRVSPAGVILDAARIPVSAGDLDQTNPVAVFDGTDFQVYWEDERDGGSVRMNRVRTDGSLVDLVGTRVDDPAAPRYSYSAIRVAHDGTDAFLAYGTAGSVAGTYSLMLQRLRGASRVGSAVSVYPGDIPRTYVHVPFDVGTAGGGRSLVAVVIDEIAPYDEPWTHVLTVRNDASGVPCSDVSDCASGFCVSGVCCDTACDGDCETCLAADGAAMDGACGPRLAGFECRPSTGACDPAEACDGTATTCPAEAPLPSECMDAGAPDAFVPDAFVAEPDAFVAEPDAFVAEPDAFVAEPDAFVAEPDAFVPAVDSGSGVDAGGADDSGSGGGGCTASGGGAGKGFAAGLLALLMFRRRRG